MGTFYTLMCDTYDYLGGTRRASWHEVAIYYFSCISDVDCPSYYYGVHSIFLDLND